MTDGPGVADGSGPTEGLAVTLGLVLAAVLGLADALELAVGLGLGEAVADGSDTDPAGPVTGCGAGPLGVTALDGLDAMLLPAALVAWTVKV